MGMNFQDVIRDVHDPQNHSLNVNATVNSSSTVYIGTPTLYAVVNTSAAGQASVVLDNSISRIGFATVAISTPTLFAVVNTAAAGQASVVIDAGFSQIGSVTVSHPISVAGNLTLSDPKGFIGLTTVVQASSARTITGNLTLSDSKTYIGLTTATIGNSPNVNVIGNLTLSDAKTFIGLTTTVLGNNSVQAFGQFFPTPQSIASGGLGPILLDQFGRTQIVNVGNITIDSGNISLKGNVTLSDSKTYIGLVTATIGGTPNVAMVGNVTLSDSKGFIGLVSVGGGVLNTITAVTDITNPVAIKGNLTLSDSKTYIGLVTATIGNTINTSVVGNITLSDSKGFIGLVSIGGGTAWADPKTYIGLVTATMSGSVNTGMTTIFPGPNQIGSVTVSHPISVAGNLTLSDSKTYVGLVTATIGNTPNISVVGNLTLSDPKGFIGLVTVVGSLSPAAGNVTLDPGSKTGIVGNLTLTDAKAYIGLTTTTLGIGDRFIGLTTTILGNNSIQAFGQFFPTLQSIASGGLGPIALDNFGRVQGVNIGNLTIDSGNISIKGNVTLSDAKTYVGLATVTNGVGDRFMGLVTAWVSGIAGNVTLSDAKTYLGLTTSTLGIGTTFIGLVTAWSRNAGTTKTLVNLPVGLGNNSLATVAVPTNNQKINTTQLILNSNITTEIAIKSGVTYLTGNASLGITLFPGGGFVMNGSPDSPVWISLPSGAMVVEKRDPGGTTSKIAGHVIYFDE